MVALSEGKEEIVKFLVNQYSHLLDFKRRNDKGDTLFIMVIFSRLPLLFCLFFLFQILMLVIFTKILHLSLLLMVLMDTLPP